MVRNVQNQIEATCIVMKRTKSASTVHRWTETTTMSYFASTAQPGAQSVDIWVSVRDIQ